MASEAVLCKKFREKIAGHLAGTKTLKPVKYMAFGDGGHTSDLKPISPSEDWTALKHEVLRKECAAVRLEADDEDGSLLVVVGKGTVENNELIDVQMSEAALVDADGELIGIKTFAPKVKEADERYQIEIKVRF